MWFGSKGRGSEDNDRRGGSSRSAARPRDRRAGHGPALPRIAWVPLAVLAGLGLMALLVWKTGEWLFWGNPAYVIKKLTVHVEGQVITPAHIRDYTGLREGTNLFAVNLGRVHADFLQKTPLAKSIVIQRQLPDTVIVNVVERVPLARLGRWGSMGVDREGYVFPLRSGTREFAVITGCAEGNMKPGARVDQQVLDALETLDACNRIKAGEQIKIASIDVSSKEYLDIYLAAGERVRLAWPGLGQPTTPEARQVLEKKVTSLASILRASEERGRRVVNLDLTYGDQYVPAQEY
jgi:cell division septal protein FtsQ